MDNIDFFTMASYCQKLREHVELYSLNPTAIQLYGNKMDELKAAISNETSDERFYLRIVEMVGATTRILNGNRLPVPHLNWIGGRYESFTRQHFIDTLKQIWPELFD